MKKRIYMKPSFEALTVQMHDLCAGSQATGIPVEIMPEIKKRNKKIFKFKEGSTIDNHMWNPDF